jgi:NitT/TauT family transport system permease protein
MNSNTLEKLSPWLFTIALFAFWEFACRAFNIDKFILPAPSEAFAAMAQHWWPLLRHSYVTLWTTMAGFALAVAFGVILGLIVGWSRTIYRGLYPVMIGFNSIPKVAIVPILIMWFGIGEVPAILTAFLISFFPIVVNVATGLATMEPELEDVLRALGARKLDIMLKVGIPRTQPYLFGSLKVAITLAFVGTIVSETVGANAGLGYLIALAGSSFQVPLVFAALILLAVEGIVMYAVFAYIEVYFTRWAFLDERGGLNAGRPKHACSKVVELLTALLSSLMRR